LLDLQHKAEQQRDDECCTANQDLLESL
jgi:hypothetical protein